MALIVPPDPLTSLGQSLFRFLFPLSKPQRFSVASTRRWVRRRGFFLVVFYFYLNSKRMIIWISFSKFSPYEHMCGSLRTRVCVCVVFPYPNLLLLCVFVKPWRCCSCQMARFEFFRNCWSLSWIFTHSRVNPEWCEKQNTSCSTGRNALLERSEEKPPGWESTPYSRGEQKKHVRTSARFGRPRQVQEQDSEATMRPKTKKRTETSLV